MRITVCVQAALFVAALLSVGPAIAQGAKGTIFGNWKTKGGQATVQIGPCQGNAARVCGHFVDLAGEGRRSRDKNNPNPALRNRPLLGMPFVTGFKPAGPNKWRSGQIYNPQDGKTYNAKMDLNPNGTLTVSGCVFVFCQGETWTRAR